MSETAPNTNDRKNYEVGYGRPPVRTRFKKGRSGNPRGRPKGSRNMKSVIESVAAEPVTLRDGQRVRRVPKQEALVQQLFAKSVTGDMRAANTLMTLMARAGLLTGPEETSSEDRLSPSEQMLFDAIASQVAAAA